MAMAATYSKALIENSNVTLSDNEIDQLLSDAESDHFVEQTFKGLYFSDDDNRLIDRIRANIKVLNDPYKKAIALTALMRACTKKRPRGIFTYTGNRYDDGRQDLKKTMETQFTDAVRIINNAVFDNGKKNVSSWKDALLLEPGAFDLVYIDPPYYTPKSDNEYVRRYHFIEGLARDWQGVEIQEHTKTKKFKSYPTPFSTRKGAEDAFDYLFGKYRESILIVSYSSNSEPTKDEMITIMSKYKKNVELVPVDYKYSFGTRKTVKRNNVQEYLFVGW